MRCVLPILFLLVIVSTSLWAQAREVIPLDGERKLEIIVHPAYGAELSKRIARPLALCFPPGDQKEKMAQVASAGMATELSRRGYFAVVPVAGDKTFFNGAEVDLPKLFAWAEKKQKIDWKRSLAFGISNGGRSVFAAAAKYPERFAGLAVCPGVLPKSVNAKALAGKPTWMRVGAEDNEAWLSKSRDAAEQLKKGKSAVDFEIVEGVGHVLPFDVDAALDFLDAQVFGFKKVSIKAPDGLEISGELYETGDRKKPTILFCHQAGSSRGEYRQIAKRLRDAGYNGLAIDQRSGRGGREVSQGVLNETAKRFGKRAGFLEARVDIETALKWLDDKEFSGPRALWGSSYSSSLALVIGAERTGLAAILAFAPGEYLRDRTMVTKAAQKLRTPTLIVSPERERQAAEPIFDALIAKSKRFHIGPQVVHGSRTLFLGPTRDEIWKVVEAFLKKQLGG